jgi:4,4'-diaponeurosporenoate glycosyltransferase
MNGTPPARYPAGNLGRVGWVLFAVGWGAGWLLLWSTRPLPRPGAARPAVAVVVPARNEAPCLPGLLASLRTQLRSGDELVVVDDHSTDATASIAAAHGARVIAAPALPAGWVGKPHACTIGAGATTAPVLVFVDADVRAGPNLLDGVAATAAGGGVVVSVQPWYDAPRLAERLTVLANVVALMGSGAFTVLGQRVRPDVAFGPVLAVDRATYERAGAHAAPDVRASLTEDIALARRVGASHVFSDRRDATSRPRSIADAVTAWSRTITAGIQATRWPVLLGVVAWVASLTGGPFAGWLAYPLSAVQVWVLGRRAGRTGLLAVVYPLLAVVLVAVVVAAGWRRVTGRTTWKGRRVS